VRIGIDARLLALQLTGIGRYTAEMSRELIRQNADAEFMLYMPNPPLADDWPSANASVRAANLPGRVGRMLWSQTLLPYQAARDGVDVFWGTTHRLPRHLPAHIARVVTIHDLVWKHAGETMRPLSRLLDSTLMPEAIKLADRVVAVSNSTAADIETEFPAARGKVRVIPLGATRLAEPDEPASLAGLGVRQPYALFVGTLEPRKNLRGLLAAWACVPEETRRGRQLVLAGGGGWGGIDLSALLRELKLEGQVIRTGYVTDRQLATLYAHARFLAMPSLYEGFGLPLVEAMSYGVPVLTSNTSSLPEVAGEASVLVDPTDIQALADGVRRLLADDELHAALASKASGQAAKFTWERAATDMRGVFEEAVGARLEQLRTS
jgi:glycosyltransferase involved in cell wall biosynthesis